ncbi:hypothetical protein [Qipengyuania marisflavi]|nr:hypothetical protein [Qipengyuania marisflavi]
MGEGLLGDAELVGERLLGQPAFLARGGDARAQLLEEGFVPDGHACDDP